MNNLNNFQISLAYLLTNFQSCFYLAGKIIIFSWQSLNICICIYNDFIWSMFFSTQKMIFSFRNAPALNWVFQKFDFVWIFLCCRIRNHAGGSGSSGSAQLLEIFLQLVTIGAVPNPKAHYTKETSPPVEIAQYIASFSWLF